MVNVTFGTAGPASQLDQIYRNQGGTLTPWFGDSTRIGDDAQWGMGMGMGMDVADVDHNGTWDIYISDLLRNTPLEEPPWATCCIWAPRVVVTPGAPNPRDPRGVAAWLDTRRTPK